MAIAMFRKGKREMSKRERSKDTSSTAGRTVAQSTFGAPRVFTQRVNIPLALTVGLPLRERSEDTSSTTGGTVVLPNGQNLP